MSAVKHMTLTEPVPQDPGTLHEGCPWREVVYIDTQVGPRGGEAWALTLECGHMAFRPKPQPDKVRLVASPSYAARYMRGAPRKVRCLHCPRVDPPHACRPADGGSSS